MPDLFDPSSWLLWVFFPAMRYVIIPALTEMDWGSYFILIPAYTFLVIAETLNWTYKDRTSETMLGGLVLILMLSYDFWRTTRLLQTSEKKLTGCKQK